MNSTAPKETKFYYMTPVQKRIGFALLMVHMFLIPILFLAYAVAVDGEAVDSLNVEFRHYAISFVLIVLTMRGYMRREFDGLLDRPIGSVVTLIMSFLAFMTLLYIVSFAIIAIVGDMDADAAETVLDITKVNFEVLFIFRVLVLPVVEEVLYRGVVFCRLVEHRRIVIYAVSILLYIVGNTWTAFVFNFDIRLFVLALQYVPTGFVCAYCYDRSGNLWTSIIFHMLANALLILAQVW